MVANKIRGAFSKIGGAFRILISRQAILIYEDKHGVNGWGAGYGDTSTMMAMAIEIKKHYNTMLDMITEVATEEGELHALQEMKEALDKLDK